MEEKSVNDCIRYVLNDREIMYLAALTGNFQFIGVNTPEVDLNSSFLHDLKDGLISKNYIEEGKASNIIIDEGVFAVISACSKPDTYILINNTKKKEIKKELHFYFAQGLIVYMRKLNLNNEYEFQIIEDKSEIFNIVNDNIIINKKINSKFDNIKIHFDILYEIKSKLKQNNNIESVISNYTELKDKKDIVEDICSLLLKPDVYFSMFLRKHVLGTVLDQYMHFIQNDNNIYLMVEDEENQLFEFKGTNYYEVLNKMKDLIIKVEQKND